MKEWIYGRNPVYEALLSRRRQPFQLLLAEGVQEKGLLVEILRLAAAQKIPIERVSRQRLDDRQTGNQGIMLQVSGYPYSNLADILNHADRSGEPPFLLILDALQDPQNLGTLLRTAEAVGIHGVLLPYRHTATVTPAVVNVSSGTSEHLLIAQVNLAQAISTLKEAGVWVIGLKASPQAQSPNEVRLDGPLGLVVGSEAHGMRPLVENSCDLLMQLPMHGRVGSLNAAVAGSVALYLAIIARQREE
jgi:23S rRNA (guanosine2251-2'-O)-methyltransferase